MQPITVICLALFAGALFLRMGRARGRGASSTKQRFRTAKLLIGALLAWLVISFNLRHLNGSLNGDPQEPESTWERVVRTLHDMF